jgi:hypothetical protein
LPKEVTTRKIVAGFHMYKQYTFLSNFVYHAFA